MQARIQRGWECVWAVGRKIWRDFNEEMILKGSELAVSESGYREGELSVVAQADRAHREWQQAQAIFNEADDPDLIDHAIYAVEAAERKYIYLLKLARKEKQIDGSLLF